MRKIILLITATAAFTMNAEVKIQEKTSSPQEGAIYRTFNILGGPVKYQFNYRIRKNAETGALSVGDSTTRSTGLGLNYGWYHNGFIRIIVNSKPVTAPAASIVCDNDNGSLAFTWPEATLKLCFPANSDRIFGEIAAAPGNRFEVAFLAQPGYKSKRTAYVPWISSGDANIKLSGKTAAAEAPWIMAYDEVENPRGIATLVLDPGQVQKRDFAGNEKSSIVTLQFMVKGDRFRFILQGIPGNYMDAETLHDKFVENGGKYLEELKQFQF